MSDTPKDLMEYTAHNTAHVIVRVKVVNGYGCQIEKSEKFVMALPCKDKANADDILAHARVLIDKRFRQPE